MQQFTTLLKLNAEELHAEHLGRNASTRWLPEAVGIDDGRVPVSLKRRRNVWDRLGKPVVEDRVLVRQAHGISVQNGVHKMPKLMVAEHEQRYHVISNAQNETDSRKFTNGYTDVNTLQGHQYARKPNRSRLVGRLSFGEGNVFHGDMCNSLQDRDVISQKSSLSLPIKSIQSQSLNEFTCDMKDSPAAISEPTCDIFKPSNCHVLASKKLPSLTMQRNSETEVLHCEQVSSPAQSKTPVHEDGNSCRNKPVKDVSYTFIDQLLTIWVLLTGCASFILTDYAGNFGCQTKAQANGTRRPQASFQAGTDKQWKARIPIIRFVHNSLLLTFFLLEVLEEPNEDFQIGGTDWRSSICSAFHSKGK